MDLPFPIWDYVSPFKPITWLAIAGVICYILTKHTSVGLIRSIPYGLFFISGLVSVGIFWPELLYPATWTSGKDRIITGYLAVFIAASAALLGLLASLAFWKKDRLLLAESLLYVFMILLTSLALNNEMSSLHYFFLFIYVVFSVALPFIRFLRERRGKTDKA